MVVVPAADLVRSRRILPDLATWMQCYAIYVAVKGVHHPDNVPELMAYQAITAKASRKFKWPSWVIYDQNFRQEAASSACQLWAKVEPSLYAQCFTGQEVQGKAGVPHVRVLTTPQQTAPSSQGSAPAGSSKPTPKGGVALRNEVCKKYNRFNGDCSYGQRC